MGGTTLKGNEAVAVTAIEWVAIAILISVVLFAAVKLAARWRR